MSNNELTPGITPITVKSLPPGASTPGEAAMANMSASNQKLANMGRIGGRRRYKGGSIVVPQHHMLYTPTGGPGTDPNSQTTDLAITGTQTDTWNKNDILATKMGGRRRYSKGGNSDWIWGCLSGGKSKRRRNGRKSRKHRKKTRRHRRR